MVPTNKPPEKVDIKFTGITSDSTGKNAWLVIPANRPDQNPQYLNLREQETHGDIQVLEINDTENTVKIANAGSTVVLTFKDNGFATPALATIPGSPMMAHSVIGALPTPPRVVPSGAVVPGLAQGIKSAGVTPGATAANDVLAARYGLQMATPANATSIAPVRTIPTRNRTTPLASQAGEAPVDPAVQRLVMEAQALEAKPRGVAFPPLPPLPGITGN